MELDKTLKETLDEFSEVENNKLADLMLELQEAQTKQEINAIKTKLLRIRSGLYPTRYIAVKEDFPEFTTSDAFNNIKKELEAGYTYSTEVYNTLNRKCTDIIAFADSLLADTEEGSKPSSTGKKGRPPRVNKSFRDFFNCTEEEYQQIIKLLKERHIEGSAAAIGDVISTLREKKYFIYDEKNDGAKLHIAIGVILGNIGEYRNFLIQIKKNPDEKIKNLLP